MALPVIMYNIDADMANDLLERLEKIASEVGVPFWLSLSTDSTTLAMRTISDVKGIALIVLGVEGQQEDPNLLAIRMGHMALQKNRDHYVVYLVKQRRQLELVVALGVRGSGFLVAPLQEKAVTHVFQALLKDYARLCANEVTQDGQWIHLKVKGSIARVRLEDVCMAQAVSKRVEVHTLTDVICITDSLDNLGKLLGDEFMRCHRSFIINPARIAYIDFREMLIHLQDCSVVPMARSFKQAMQQYISAQ